MKNDLLMQKKAKDFKNALALFDHSNIFSGLLTYNKWWLMMFPNEPAMIFYTVAWWHHSPIKPVKKVIGVAKTHQLINPIELPYLKHSKLPASRKHKNAESLSCVLKRFKNCCCDGLVLLICLALHLYRMNMPISMSKRLKMIILSPCFLPALL